MDHIDTYFTNVINTDNNFNPAICATVGLGKKTLNRYYSMPNMAEVYHIATGKYEMVCSLLISKLTLGPGTVLHPHHKLEYFKTAGWPNDWIETAEGLVHDEFEHSYSLLHASDEENGLMADADVVMAAPVHFLIVSV